MPTVNGLLGRKVGMTQVFTEAPVRVDTPAAKSAKDKDARIVQGGIVVPVTVIECGPCVVVQHKTTAADGYEAVQLGYLERKTGRRKDNKIDRGDTGHRGRGEANKPQQAHFEAHGKGAVTRHLREFRLAGEGEQPAAGSTLTVDAMFKIGDHIKVQGTSKGRGFAGAMKRHNFKGQGASHGAKIHRKPASGGATDPARTFPGSRRPGRMGAVNVTQLGLVVVDIDAGRNLLIVKGAVPGAPGGLLRIEKVAR